MARLHSNVSKIIRSLRGRLALLTLALCGVAISVLRVREAQGAPYVNPFWANNSTSQESAIDMVADRATICESGNATAAGSRLSIDLRTGEIFYHRIPDDDDDRGDGDIEGESHKEFPPDDDANGDGIPDDFEDEDGGDSHYDGPAGGYHDDGGDDTNDDGIPDDDEGGLAESD
jgi:hypothetical protein